MANQLKIYLQVNDTLMSSIRKGRAHQYLDVKVDGLSIGRIGNSHTFLIENGRHNIHLTYHYDAEYGGGQRSDFTCHSDVPCIIDDDDCEITVNVYFLNADRIEFVMGYEPFDPQKAKSKGCYVATCVYGSYDCPEVWTLRRFRDETLGVTWYGRAFIHTYYAVSPTLVKWFGETTWFKKMWRGTLDRMVRNLQESGVAASPYEDKKW